MPNAATVAIAIAALLAGQPLHAADPASRTEPNRSGAVSAEPETAPHGAQLFATHCAMCHQPADLAQQLGQ